MYSHTLLTVLCISFTNINVQVANCLHLLQEKWSKDFLVEYTVTAIVWYKQKCNRYLTGMVISGFSIRIRVSGKTSGVGGKGTTPAEVVTLGWGYTGA